MLHVPTIRQPSDTACLPTCVRAVLAYRGLQLSDEDAATICGSDEEGTVVDLAVDGLADAGVDAELHQFRGIADLRSAVEDGQPVIVVLRHPSRALHAVVVCAVGDEAVMMMDPGLGDYTTLALPRFEALWCGLQNEGLLVGTKADAPAGVRQGSVHEQV